MNRELEKESIMNQEILTEKERTYLSNVCHPFMDKKIIIIKYWFDICSDFIVINIYRQDSRGMDGIILPNFPSGTMYKNMKYEKEYSLQELKMI